MTQINLIKTVKKCVLALLAITSITSSFAQVGIGTTMPDASAILDVESFSKGFLPPRMTSEQMYAISSPATGLLVYCTDCSPTGYYGYNGSLFLAIEFSGVSNSVPTASSVSFSGSLESGELLTGIYTYNDVDSDTEGSSTFVWYRADDALGTGQIAITGATSSTYTLQVADENKYIAFEVTPVAATGNSPGAASISSYQGPITGQ